jgi:hypothetical protein
LHDLAHAHEVGSQAIGYAATREGGLVEEPDACPRRKTVLAL